MHRFPCLPLLVVLSLNGCGSDDPVVERRGGDLPTPTGAAGEAPMGEGGASIVDQVPFCSALDVIRCKCQQCHQNPPQYGAPVPFMTYEDTQAPYDSMGKTYSDAMLHVIENDIMPLLQLNDPPVNLAPPAMPLSPPEKETLLAWLKQGAKPVGGTDCPKKQQCSSAD